MKATACRGVKGVVSSRASRVLALDDQQSSAIAPGSLLLLGGATLFVHVGRAAAARELGQRSTTGACGSWAWTRGG